jgi:hypothetical protein
VLHISVISPSKPSLDNSGSFPAAAARLKRLAALQFNAQTDVYPSELSKNMRAAVRENPKSPNCSFDSGEMRAKN